MSKRVTLIVNRSDRNMWDDGPLTCRVIDLFASGGPQVLMTRSIPPAVELELEVPFDSLNAYGISVDAVGHRSGWHVLNRRSFLRADVAGEREVDHTIVRTMLVHRQAAPSDLVVAFRELESRGSPFAVFGADRFNSLRAVSAKLAFLNLEAKLRDTRIATAPLLSFVRDVREVHVDRVFLFVAAGLRALIEASAEFEDAPGHGVPEAFPHLPAHPDSWKHTRFTFGNVQMSFSNSAILHRGVGPSSEPCFSVDCDIDLERDLGHAFEFVHNKVFSKTTDQTLVYRMLWDQGILPAYHLVPPVAVTAAARVRVAAALAPAAPARARAAAGKLVRGRRRTSAAKAAGSRAGQMGKPSRSAAPASRRQARRTAAATRLRAKRRPGGSR